MPPVELTHGNFSWIDLVTTDTASSRVFYEGLFGWGGSSGPSPTGAGYHMFEKNGVPVAGMIAIPPGADFPPSWVSYILVDDLDSVAANAHGLGGAVLAEPRAVGPAGRMAMIQDLTGAAVGLWEAGEFTGAGLFNEPGALAWNELVTRDVPAAMEFYGELLGWGWEPMKMPDGSEYHICRVKDRPSGGLMAMTAAYPPETPPHWATYFQVARVAESHPRALELGARELVPPEMTGMGPISVIQDPAGAVLSLFQVAPGTREAGA
jgi:predicted enzyme related to lactoylglutathione lyase